MNEDRLKALIEQADFDPIAQDKNPFELAGRVRVLHRRRQHRKLAFAAALFVLGSLLWRGLADRHKVELAGSVPKKQPVASGVIDASDDRLLEIRKRIDREEMIIDRLLAAERVRRLLVATGAATTRLDSRLFLDEQIGQAAMAVLSTADRRPKQPENIETTREDYVYVTKTFPNTIWAERAGKSLAALKP